MNLTIIEEIGGTGQILEKTGRKKKKKTFLQLAEVNKLACHCVGVSELTEVAHRNFKILL
jgi:hypothetical protein